MVKKDKLVTQDFGNKKAIHSSDSSIIQNILTKHIDKEDIFTLMTPSCPTYPTHTDRTCIDF